MYKELLEMCELQYLPLAKDGIGAFYEGSIDKWGGNADWTWELYKEPDKNEWVIFENIGAGCILNFVQHRFIKSSEVTFRFYFDGEEKPRFEIKPYEFGEKFPFIEPLASKYIARGARNQVVPYESAIRVVRSFVPMPFAKSCKITSSLPLINSSIPEGGWGHVIYHKYTDPNGVETFTPENPDYHRLINLWTQVGRAPIKGEDTYSSFTLHPGKSEVIFKDDSAGLITGIKLKTKGFRKDHLLDLAVTAKWDGHAENDVDANFGCIFSNEQGSNKTSYLLAGLNPDGEYYCYYPMPYLKSAEISVVNNGCEAVDFELAVVSSSREYNSLYKNNKFGYFTTSPYHKRQCTHGSDSIIAEISGSGHIISALITGYAMEEGANCEGDVRVHFDGIRTPRIESDGSESYACYGWGFEAPHQCNPSSGYDGHIGERYFFDAYQPECWSMTRQLTGDYYPFRSKVRFGIESFGCNERDMEHSGMIFYYRTGDSREFDIAEIVIGDKVSEQKVNYRRLDGASEPTVKTSYFEGDDDDIQLTFSGYYGGDGCSFEIPIDNEVEQIVIKRVSDQSECRQLAKVYVDGEEVTEYPWYFPDHNPYKSWLEDEFVIPGKYIKGKNAVTIRIVPLPCGGKTFFNEFGYRICGVK